MCVLPQWGREYFMYNNYYNSYSTIIKIFIHLLKNRCMTNQITVSRMGETGICFSTRFKQSSRFILVYAPQSP